MPREEHNDWTNLTQEEYDAAEERLVEPRLSAVEKYLGKIRGQTDYPDAAIPKMFEKCTPHLAGGLFTTKFEGLEISMRLRKEINGLFHSDCARVIMSDCPGAVNYRVMAAKDVAESLLSGPRNV